MGALSKLQALRALSRAPARARRPANRLCATRATLLDQAVFQRIADQFGGRLHAHLLHDAALMGAYGLDAQIELVGDRADRFAPDQTLEHL
jgi:hypothetical protein